MLYGVKGEVPPPFRRAQHVARLAEIFSIIRKQSPRAVLYGVKGQPVTTQELIEWHASGRAAALVATTIRNSPPVAQRACIECDRVHGPGTCPICRACDWSPARPCWNCDDEPALAL